MRRMGHEFEGWRRQHTFLPSPKLPRIAPQWGGEGGSARNASTELPALQQCWSRRQPKAHRQSTSRRPPVTRSGSMHGGWGRRAPSWVHRRLRGGALEALGRCPVEDLVRQVEDCDINIGRSSTHPVFICAGAPGTEARMSEALPREFELGGCGQPRLVHTEAWRAGAGRPFERHSHSVRMTNQRWL